jgi:hypothetical protein
MPLRRWYKPLLIAAIVAMSVCFILLLTNGLNRIGKNTGDFRHFYDAARAMAGGGDVYASGTGGYIYPPLLAFLYLPLAGLTRMHAEFVALIANLAFCIGSIALITRAVERRVFARNRRWLSAILAGALSLVMFDKLKGETQMWQTNIILVFCCALALHQLYKRPWLAGLALGLAINIKYLPLVLIPWLIIRRRFTAAAFTLVGILAFAMLPGTYNGWSTNLAHWRTALAGMERLAGADTSGQQAANVETITSHFSVSIPSTIARWLHGDSFTRAGVVNQDEHARTGLLIAGVIGLIVAGICALAYYRQRTPLWLWPSAQRQLVPPFTGTLALELACILALALAFSPQTNPRHLVLLMPMLALMVTLLVPLRSSTPGRVPILITFIALMAALHLPPGGRTFDAAVRWWREVGGIAWTLAIITPVLIWATLARWQPSAPAPRV